MALDGTEVRRGLSGHLYIGDVGVDMPDDTATSLDPDDWTELGYTSEEALSMGVETESSEIRAWQALTAVRTDVTQQTVSFSFSLIQTNRDTLSTAFNGGSFSAGSTPGDTIFTPPAASTAAEHAFVFEVLDGDIITRIRVSRASVSELGDVVFNKEDATGYEITLTALAAAGDDAPWDLITNDPALAA